MTVTPDDVRHIASLARLALSEEEVERFTPQLDAILGHAAELESTDANESGPSDADGRGAPLAGDAPGADPLLASPEALAPEWKAGFFTVPRLAAMQGTEVDES
jgi:aspartyl-tRNA(Asn)/glutamyl-tRNA(Gln) amidotransferase subunit C